MPLVIEPSKDKSNGVGKIFKSISFVLSFFLPLLTISLTLIWCLNNSFSKFI